MIAADKQKLAESLPYRDCVGAVLLNDDGRVFVGRRIADRDDGLEHFWQMPQGGIDAGEEPAEAVMRELFEETGIRDAEIIAESKTWLHYTLPDHLLGVAWNGRYRGQRQKWFALRFRGREVDIDVAAGDCPEFSDWRWVDIEDLPKLIVPFKRQAYKRIVDEFRHLAVAKGETDR